MGLDTVELVMEFEDEFELRIPDAEAEKLGTIGDTVTYIVAALRARRPERCPEGVCPSSHAFYRLRRKVLDAMAGTPLRAAVRPDARLGDLVPRSERSRVWSQVRGAVGLPNWPRFRLSAPLASRFPPPETTVREVVHRMLERTLPDYYIDGDVDQERVFLKVVQITSEQLGIDPGQIRWSSHYVYDLGAD